MRDDYFCVVFVVINDFNIFVNVVFICVKQFKCGSCVLVVLLEKMFFEDIVLCEVVEGKISYEFGLVGFSW